MTDRHAHHHRAFRCSRGRDTTNRAVFRPRCSRRWCRHLRLFRRCRLFGHHLVRRLVLTQPLERCLSDVARAGPAREFDLGHEVRAQPVHIGFFRRRVLAAERTLACSIGFQFRHQPLHHVLPETRADIADIDQMIAAMDARHQRAEFAGIALPAAEYHLMPGAAFRFDPVHGAFRAIRRIEPLGDDAFQRHPARRAQHRIAAGLEMFDVTDIAMRGALDAVLQ